MIKSFTRIRPVKTIAYLKQIVGTIVISCAFIDPILAKKALISRFNENVIHYKHTVPPYCYAGITAGASSLQVKKMHKALGQYTALSPFPSPSGSVILGLFVGRQITSYMAIELSLVEWNIGGNEYEVDNDPFHRFPALKNSSTNYTVGAAFDCIPMVPISDRSSLLSVIGIGGKTAGIEILDKKVFKKIGWKAIPRIGLGAVINDECGRYSGKILVEFNNAFQNNKASIFHPSLVFCIHMAMNFN
mgnify:CR=1 FL=1